VRFEGKTSRTQSRGITAGTNFAGGCTKIMFLLGIGQSYDAQNGIILLSGYCTVVTNTKP